MYRPGPGNNMPVCVACGRKRKNAMEKWHRLMLQVDWRQTVRAHFCEECGDTIIKTAERVAARA